MNTRRIQTLRRAGNRQILTYAWQGLGLLFLLLIGWSIVNTITSNVANALAPVVQQDLATDQIYAYRDWQSVGIRVEKDDWITIRAEGAWLYTPGEYHGPQGHPRFAAPTFYPVPSISGGSLIGRVGERGQAFHVGRYTQQIASKDGMLYFRINDDKLTDNDGVVKVEVEIARSIN